MYSITPKGRRALADWMKEPGAAPVLEFEAMIKVFFAEHGTKEELLATIEGVRRWTEDRARQGVELSRGYLEGRGQFPERLPWLILTGQFLEDIEAVVALGRVGRRCGRDLARRHHPGDCRTWTCCVRRPHAGRFASTPCGGRFVVVNREAALFVPAYCHIVSWFRRLVEAFRPAGDIAQVMRPLEGSAAFPEPPMLVVPEDLKRAVDEENRRKAAEEQASESD